jgi:hypothetical protein
LAKSGQKIYNASWALIAWRRWVGTDVTAVRSPALLTEQEVSRSWSQIFKGSKFESEAFDRAEDLLEELRPESPLRHRLTHELEELRKLQITR